MKKSNAAKEHFYVLFAMLGLLVFFYPDLFLARQASLAGDHWEQHFPWAWQLSQVLRNFNLPFWTPLIHCGFPIAAEGQIGIFYLPNLLLSFLLPVRWAYAYTHIAHSLFSGWGTYLYAREMKLKPFPAFLAGFFFVFGTAYAGAFYNITSLKTLSWFPFSLFLWERYLRGNGKIYLAAISAAIGMSLLAGYLQVALFSLVIFIVYAGLRIFLYPPEEGSDPIFQSVGCALALAGGFLIALPQLLLTFPLALLSNRVNLAEEYAYVGSLSPAALLTFVFPTFQGFLRGNCLYLGLFSIYLVIHAFTLKEVRKSEPFRIWVVMAVLSLLLALGEWSPLYVALVKLTRFYSFRVPAKFLVFICFAVSMLAAMGFEALQKSLADKGSRALKNAAKIYAAIIGLAAGCYAALYSLLAYARPLAQEMGRWLIARFIYGRMGHPYSLGDYYQKLNDSLESIYLRLSFDNPWNRWIFVLIAVHIVLVFALAYRKVPAKGTGYLLAALLMLSVVDLYIFSFADIKRDFDSYARVLAPHPVLERLQSIQAEGKLGRIYGFRQEGENLPLVPSANMLYGFEDIGGYSPFVLRRYFETIGLFGNVNDSNRAFNPTPEFVKERLKFLSAIGVSHILSTQELKDSHLKLLLQDRGTFLYENEEPFSRAHFVTQQETFPDWELLKERLMQPGFDPAQILLLEVSDGPIAPFGERGNDHSQVSKLLKREDRLEVWSLETDRPGYFVLMNTYYPGWAARVDNEKVTLLRAYGLFQAVAITAPGRHEITFEFHPFSHDK